MKWVCLEILKLSQLLVGYDPRQRWDAAEATHYLQFLKYVSLYVTRHEKKGHMCTKCTPSHYFMFNPVSQAHLLCKIYKFYKLQENIHCVLQYMYSFIDKPFLSTKLLNLNPKSGQILCIHKPYFLMPGYIYVSTVLDNIMCMCCVGGEMHCSSVTTSVLYAHIQLQLC